MRKRVILGFGLACVACCAPLLLPLLGIGGVASLGGWLSGLGWAEVICLGLIAGAGLVALALRRRRQKADGPYCDVRE